MKRGLIDKLVDVLTVGNRPIRIFIFGGIFLAYIIMLLLGKIFGMEGNIGDEGDLLNILVMIASILIGFGTSYSFIWWLENAKQPPEDGDHE